MHLLVIFCGVMVQSAALLWLHGMLLKRTGKCKDVKLNFRLVFGWSAAVFAVYMLVTRAARPPAAAVHPLMAQEVITSAPDF